MSSHDAGEVGERIEERVAEIKGWEREEAEHFDARNRAGDPVEIKACREWVSNGGSERTRGRWWIQRANHERLADADGWYCMVVYSGEPDDPEILSAAMIPAAWLESYPGEWTTTGHPSSEEAVRIRNDALVAINGGEKA